MNKERFEALNDLLLLPNILNRIIIDYEIVCSSTASQTSETGDKRKIYTIQRLLELQYEDIQEPEILNKWPQIFTKYFMDSKPRRQRPNGFWRRNKHKEEHDILREQIELYWYYQDDKGTIQGPFSSAAIECWYKGGYFTERTLLATSKTARQGNPPIELFRDLSDYLNSKETFMNKGDTVPIKRNLNVNKRYLKGTLDQTISHNRRVELVSSEQREIKLRELEKKMEEETAQLETDRYWERYNAMRENLESVSILPLLPTLLSEPSGDDSQVDEPNVSYYLGPPPGLSKEKKSSCCSPWTFKK